MKDGINKIKVRDVLISKRDGFIGRVIGLKPSFNERNTVCTLQALEDDGGQRQINSAYLEHVTEERLVELQKTWQAHLDHTVKMIRDAIKA
jgi:hypothetical protein